MLPLDRVSCRTFGASIRTASFEKHLPYPLKTRALKREILREFPSGGYMTIIEHWRQLPDGQIQFTMRRLPTAD